MLDAIIISDSGSDTYSASSPLRLQIDGQIALIQRVANFLENNGKIVAPVKGENEKNWHGAPKLNGISLYNYLKNNHRVDLIDSYYEQRDEFVALLNQSPKAVVISTTFISSKKSLFDLVADIRSLAPDIYIIAGGPFVYSSYLLTQRAGEKDYDVKSPEADFLFLSSNNRPDVDLYIIDKGGESILSQALTRLKSGQKPGDLSNTASFEGNGYQFERREQLDQPADLIDWLNMPGKIFKTGVVNVQASVGCPFNCEFCNFVKDKRYTYVKPLDQLVAELKAIAQKGIHLVRFVDDNFRLGKRDLDRVCKRFLKEELDIKWMSFIRASTLAQADLDLLKRAGCVEVQMGIESADRSVLTKMNKSANPVMYRQVISDLLDRGINCSCCFVVGFPGETEKTFQNTFDFIQTISKPAQEGVFYWSIYPFLLAPLSPIYETEKRARYQLEGYMHKWRHRTMDSNQALKLIMSAFKKIDSASPIYSGDNIDMLMALSPEKRKTFMRVRHELSKRFLTEPFDRELVLKEFSSVLGL